MKLRYGLNPQQSASMEPVEPETWPIRLLSGEPSYINVLDALNSWRLVLDAERAFGRPAAASFKHVSPAGAALAGEIDDVVAELFAVDRGTIGPLTSAYLRARDADPKSSYGDFVAVSRPVDLELADLLSRLICDGIIAPGYEPGTVEILGKKRSGRFLVVEGDPTYEPPAHEVREIAGLRLVQRRDPVELTPAVLGDPVSGTLPARAAADLLLGLVVLRHTQSNSVCYVRDGMTLGIGAGQQSRVDCTRLAGRKVDTWWLRRHPDIRGLQFSPELRRQDRINWQVRCCEGDLTADEEAQLASVLVAPPHRLTDEERSVWRADLTDVAFASDGALPFRDNVDHAAVHGVRYIVEPGGSIRSSDVVEACATQGIAIAHTGLRLFHH